MQAERGATLIPAINAGAWEQGMSTRLVLFRDWLVVDGESRSSHFVGVQKLNGKSVDLGVDNICAFSIKPVSDMNHHNMQELIANAVADRIDSGGIRQHAGL